MNKFIALSGLPRAGSTLLSSILSQNSDIHSEGNSAVCQMMWDMQESCQKACAEQLSATKRYSTQNDVISAIPSLYYKDVTAKYIVDKCRSWTLPNNVEMLHRYFTYSPKVIVLERPLIEVVKSYAYLRLQNNYLGDPYYGLLEDWSEPIIRSFNGIKWAKQNNSGEFLFVTYKDLVESTEDCINNIYDFCEIEPFKHNLSNIVNIHPEDDAVYNLIGQHDVRNNISYRDINIDVPKHIIDKCNILENDI